MLKVTYERILQYFVTLWEPPPPPPPQYQIFFLGLGSHLAGRSHFWPYCT
jgi:hypothetical protein